MSQSSFRNLNYIVKCPNCRKTPNLVEDFASGDMICDECGCVVGDRIIDTRSEWRTFSSDNGEDPSRVGGPNNPLLDTDQLDTIISKKDGHSGTSQTLNRLQSRHALKNNERTLLAAFKSISILCERISLPKVIADRAKQLFKMVFDKKLLKGKTNEGVISACIYIACRQEQVPRSFKEISSLTLVSRKDIGKCFKMITPLLETNMSTITTNDFILRFCSHLSLDSKVQKAATFVSEQLEKDGVLAGKSPTTIAAAGILMVTMIYPEYNRQLKDISFVSGVSEVTIKAAYKELYHLRHKLIPADFALPAIIDNLPIS